MSLSMTWAPASKNAVKLNGLTNVVLQLPCIEKEIN
jgi:hypothetical protein